jgi:thymidylate synthase
MKQYLTLLKDVLENGVSDDDRTGTGTRSVFGRQMRIDLRNKFPLLTTKKTHLKSIIHELLWILKGDTNVEYLQDNNVSIWNEWCDSKGNLGPVYGKMLRAFPFAEKHGMGTKLSSVDQLTELVSQIQNNPTSRRMVVSMWHPGLLPDTSISPKENAENNKQALPPCHTLFQCQTEPMPLKARVDYAIDVMGASVTNKAGHAVLDAHDVPSRYLSLQLYQRSADIFLGVPFNFSSYSLLTMMLAQVTNTVAKDFVHTFGDLHLYNNHVKQAKEQLSRKPLPLPTMHVNNRAQAIDAYEYSDFEIKDYESHPAIKAKVSI